MENTSRACVDRRTAAAAQLAQKQPHLPAEKVTASLIDGLDVLRERLFERIHKDVEKNVGQDSMLQPLSVEKSEQLANREIESCQISVVALEASGRRYISCDNKWFVSWLAQLRMGEQLKEAKWRRRVRRYLAMSDDDFRLEFSRKLENVFPEARLAPLILYRLFPLSVRVATAVAFGQHLEAAEIRNRQMFWLPAIGDCHACHGRPLDNGEECKVCGNPVWTYRWLCAE